MLRTIADISDEVLAVALKIKKLEDQVKILEDEESQLKEELRLAADGQNLTQGGGTKSKWTIEPQVVPQATDWDAFYPWMARKKWFHLLQRRPAVKACQELWSQGITIPGIDKYTTMKVTVKGV